MTASNSPIASADARGAPFPLDAVDLSGTGAGPWRVVHAPGGGAGRDFTANPIAIPNVGAAFANAGPYANYALVKTIPANPARAGVGVPNLSGDRIVIVRDDGTVSPGSPPSNATIIALEGGGAVGLQGGSWSSTTFRGRVQVYAPNYLAFVPCWED